MEKASFPHSTWATLVMFKPKHVSLPVKSIRCSPKRNCFVFASIANKRHCTEHGQHQRSWKTSICRPQIYLGKGKFLFLLNMHLVKYNDFFIFFFINLLLWLFSVPVFHQPESLNAAYLLGSDCVSCFCTKMRVNWGEANPASHMLHSSGKRDHISWMPGGLGGHFPIRAFPPTPCTSTLHPKG